MKTKDTKIERSTKLISTTVVLEDNREFIMCGEIVDRILQDKIDPVFYQDEMFNKLPDKIKVLIRQTAKIEFERNYTKY